MAMSLGRRWLRQLNGRFANSGGRGGQKRERYAILRVEALEARDVPASFTAGNIAVLDLAAATTNTTGTILELSPSTSNQSTPVQSIGIASTGGSAIRFSDSGTSSFLSDSNDRSLLIFSAYNTTTTSGNLASLNPRGVGTLNSSGTFNLAATYNVSSADLTAGNQTRSAATLDDTNYFITDKGGLYTNNSTNPSLSTNILNARSFGGTVYISSTKATAGVSTASSPTATTLTGLPGLPGDGAIQDFYLIQSGQNGTTYDILYTLDQNSNNATINKFSLVSGSWVSNGTFTYTPNAEAMIAENDGAGGAFLFVTTTSGTANNSLVRLTDTAGYNATININTTNNVTLYTDTNSDLLKGLDFVPAGATAPSVANPSSNNVGTNSATLGGTVTGTGSPGVVSYGVVYSATNTSPTINGAGVTQAPASGTPVFSPFTVGVGGLQGVTKYYYAAYATNAAGTSYSAVGNFTTQSSNPPTIDTPTDTGISSTGATLGGKVESDGGATVTKSGVVYALTSVNNNPQIGGNGVTEVDTASPVDSGAFTVSAASLTPGAGYTFEAFATNGSGTSYTTATSFTTLAPPTVNMPTAVNVTGNSASLGGNVASNGGSTVTKTGVVYALTSQNANPQIGGSGVTEVDTGSAVNSGGFALTAMGLSASAGYTFEAFATNAIGTSYTAPTSFTTASPGVITAWTFPVAAAAPDNSPAPTYGNGSATTLGMTNNLTNANGTGNTASDDVLSTSGAANTNFTENLWRIRGTPNNGWAQSAPQYSQGVELDTSTVGYSNIVFAFDWYSTTQGIRDLQVQYNTGGGWVNYQGPSPTGTFVATSNDYYNAGLSPVNPTIYVNLSNVPAANNNPDLGIRLVSAYDSTGTLESSSPSTPYASAASTAADIAPYNNSSGNWRFGNLTFYGNLTTTTTTLSASPPGGQNPGQPVTFTATVTPASGAQFPSGTVTFYDGTTQIGTTRTVTQVGSTNVGTATLTLNTLAPGIHGDITAQYTPTPGNGLLASGSSMNLVAGDPTDNPISYSINAPQATGVDVSPVVGQPFIGVVATFSDGSITSNAGFTASINWGDTHVSSGVVTFLGTKNEANIFGQIVPVTLFSVTGTNTYAAAGTYPISVTITDPNSNVTTVNPTARVAYPSLLVSPVPALSTPGGLSLSGATVATFTDSGLVANLSALGINDPTTQFSASISWGDNTPASAGSVTYNSSTKVFSVAGSHTYAAPGSYSISVSVTPNTVSVERIDSSDPTALNLVGDENGDGLTDSPSPDFIDQYVIGAASQGAPLYTTSLPDVATSGGNEALTNSSYSVSEGELTLSTNGQYLVLGGYNDTASAWAPQQTFSSASVINRVIGTVNGNSTINTTTALTDTYSGDNFRGVASTDGTQFWTSGHSSGSTNDFVHYATLGAATSTIITGPAGASNVNTVEIFNGQLYEGVRSTSNSAAGIFQIGTGLPTTAGQPQTLFIEVPQSNPLDITDGNAPMGPFSFWMADLPGNPNAVNGVNVCYVADAEMGIARYDYNGSTWQFSYYIDQTGAFKDGVYTVNSDGSVATTAAFNSTNPIPTSNPNADPSKVGGVRGLTGRIVNGQVQLFATSGFGTDSQPHPGGSLVEVTDPEALTVPSNFLKTTDALTTLATNPTADPSELTDVAFSPTATVSDSLAVLTNLSGQTKSTATGAAVNHATGLYTSTLTVQNISSSTFAGGFLIQLSNLPAGVTLAGATITIGGRATTLSTMQTAGGPLVLVPSTLVSSLAPGQSLGIALQFSNPSRKSITFGDSIFSDPTDQL
jgi:hypothetical protein